MPLSVHVLDENGNPERSGEGSKLEAFQDLPTVNLERMLRECWKDESFHLLRFIDFYGDTVFNRLQLPRFLIEWRSLRPANDEDGAFLLCVEDLASVVASQVHLYLKFVGD